MNISQHCFAITGLYFLPPWSVNAGFVVGSHTTLIIDTGSNRLSAQTIHGYAGALRPEKTLTVINTEKHLDHIGGNCFFHDRHIKA